MKMNRLTGIEEARRRARPEAYKDSPILLNIAQGRGFVGEAAELSKLTGLNTDKLFTIPGIDADVTLGTLYTAGLFAADLLDPSLDFAYAGLKGLRTAGEFGFAASKLGVKSYASKAAKFAAADSLKTFLSETPAVSAVNSAAAKFLGVPKLAPGDIRLSISDAVARQASDDLLDAQGARRAIAPDSPKPVKDINAKT
jgi:hypothetical protein